MFNIITRMFKPKVQPTKPDYLNKQGNIQWKANPMLRIDMYKILLREIGPFTGSSNGKPTGINTAQWNTIIKNITIELGLPENKWEAVANQIAWATTNQPKPTQKGYLDNYILNRSAAVLAGYKSCDQF